MKHIKENKDLKGAMEHAAKHAEQTPEQDKKPESDSITISKKEHDDLLKAKDAQKELVYAYAEFDNYKKRHAKDVLQQMAFANEKLVKEMLPIIDNLSRAKEHACEEDTKGLELIMKQLKDALDKFGVKELSSVGEKFDPNFHEAMEKTESDDHDADSVTEEYQKGYTMHGRLIRPCKVCVNTKKKKEE
ncbi:MAG: nucleotide exchange factor GrpE [Pseudomonadota bacterium]